MIDPSARIHATADLEPDVSVGPGTSVWHRAQIRRGARVGRDGVIGRDVFIDEGVTLGDRVKVQNGALIYHGVTISDGVFVGPGAILTNDRRPRARNVDGDTAQANDWTVAPISIALGASIGAGAVVVAGCDIGAHAMVGAGSVVTHPVASHALVAGNPARAIGWVCICGDPLADPRGDRAAPELPAADEELTCLNCDRRYTSRPGRAGLLERTSSPNHPVVSA
jgi:UDP-2-acetamido-3-amino-2,3-dideoxy-glucuronate N-acetyltransferase